MVKFPFRAVGAIAILALVASCDSNKKLEQENAEAAIKTVLSNHTVSQSAKESLFNVQSVVKFGPVNQFSETEAYSIVKFKDHWLGPFAMKFVFQKNVDRKWVLTKLDFAGPPDGSPLETSGHEAMIVQSNQNLNVVAQ